MSDINAQTISQIETDAKRGRGRPRKYETVEERKRVCNKAFRENRPDYPKTYYHQNPEIVNRKAVCEECGHSYFTRQKKKHEILKCHLKAISKKSTKSPKIE